MSKENRVSEVESMVKAVMGSTLPSKGPNTSVKLIKASSTGKDLSPKSITHPTGEPDAGQGIIDPPYDPTALSKFRENNNALIPMVDAYKTNIAGFGFDFQYNIDMNSEDVEESIKEKAKQEWILLENFYKYCNFDNSFCDILMRMIDDREYIGYGVLEVLTGTSGKPTGFEYVPAHTIKISRLHPDPQVVKLEAVDPLGKVTTIGFEKRFRRYRQEVDNESVWFKEFGDPRRMNRNTGAYEVELDNAGVEVKIVIEPEDEASSLILFPISVPYSVYGLPRWIGNMLGMQGSRKSEELNYNYFIKGRHTPLAIVVNNGSLTESSMDVLQSYVDKVQGVENAFGYLILEASGFEDDDPNADASTKASIEIKPLIDAIQNDGLFQEYDKNNRDKLREAMRLAPIYTGASKDYTRATADVAKAITEEQVFQPERKAIGGKINRLVNQALGIKYVDMILSSPDITNKKDLADTISVYTKTGGITPNMVVEAVSQLLGQTVEQLPDSWGNLPINIVLELIKQKQLTYTDLVPNGPDVGGDGNEGNEGNEGNNDPDDGATGATNPQEGTPE